MSREPTLLRRTGRPRASPAAECVTLGEALAAYEKDLIQDALKTTRGVRSRAARLLNTTDRIFNDKVRKYGVDWRRFR